jgi:hypothetical protein
VLKNTVSTGNRNNAVCGPASSIVQISVVGMVCRTARLKNFHPDSLASGLHFCILFHNNSAGVRVFKTPPLSLNQCCFEAFVSRVLDKQYSNNNMNIVYIFTYTHARAQTLVLEWTSLDSLVRFVWTIRINKLKKYVLPANKCYWFPRISFFLLRKVINMKGFNFYPPDYTYVCVSHIHSTILIFCFSSDRYLLRHNFELLISNI